jgi:hypothetical protein
MSKLIVAELKTSLVQRYTIGNKSLDVQAIRPELMFFANPAGSLTLQIEDTNGKLVAASETLSIAAIKAAIASLGYDHGMLRFYCNAYLRKNTSYDFRLVPSGGYAFSEAGYVAWCAGFELAKYGADYSPSAGWSSALNLELWGQKQIIRRAG